MPKLYFSRKLLKQISYPVPSEHVKLEGPPPPLFLCENSSCFFKILPHFFINLTQVIVNFSDNKIFTIKPVGNIMEWLTLFFGLQLSDSTEKCCFIVKIVDSYVKDRFVRQQNMESNIPYICENLSIEYMNSVCEFVNSHLSILRFLAQSDMRQFGMSVPREDRYYRHS